MKIGIEKVLNLQDGEHRFDFVTSGHDLAPDQADFEGAPVFAQDVRTHVRLQKSGHMYRVTLDCETSVHLVCDRCLSEVMHPVEGRFEIIFSERKRDDLEDSDDWRVFDPRQTNQIELDKDVHDTLILALPGKTLCQENCRGLCPECGANLNERLCEHVSQTIEN